MKYLMRCRFRVSRIRIRTFKCWRFLAKNLVSTSSIRYYSGISGDTGCSARDEGTRASPRETRAGSLDL